MQLDDEKAFGLLDNLQKQLEAFKVFLELTKLQQTQISSGNEEQLLITFDKKKKFIEIIDELNQEYVEERKLLEETKLGMGEFSSLDDELDLVLQELEGVMREILEMDGVDLKRLSEKAQQNSGQQEQLGRAKELTRAYRAGARPKQSNMDIEG